MLTEREKKLTAALAQAVRYIEYTEAFRGRLTARKDMYDVIDKWRTDNANVTFGIGVGATYLADAEFSYRETRDLLQVCELVDGGPVDEFPTWALKGEFA